MIPVPVLHVGSEAMALQDNAAGTTMVAVQVLIQLISNESLTVIVCMPPKTPVKNPNDPPSQQVIIDGIVGYEILRGSREGNKTILAKGIINNTRGYTLTDDALVDQGVEGVYPNYPYNDLNADYFFSETKVKGNDSETEVPLTKVYQDLVTFHSPDTTFKKPFLGEDEIK